jgi:ubiquinone/menaquinone biosynthesis C-methylase UbiE
MLPEMQGDWDELFAADRYLRTHEGLFTDEASTTQAHAALALAEVPAVADVLDCPCGFGRHAAVLARAGHRVVAVDRSATLLEEARRRFGDSGARFERGDYRRLELPDDTVDAVLCLYSSLGYLGRDGDIGVLREFRRVLRDGGALVVEVAHRDAIVAGFVPRTWSPLGESAFFLQQRSFDPLTGVMSTTHTILEEGGEQSSHHSAHRFYAAPEWLQMLDEAGFGRVDAFGGLDGRPFALDTPTRLVLRAR